MKEISGDSSLSIKNTFLYLVFNFFRGVAGYTSFVKTVYVRIPKLAEENESPSRKQSNQFLQQILPDILPSKELDVLDIGCGSGYFVSLLSKLAYSGNYVGLDIAKHRNFDKITGDRFRLSMVISYITEYQTEKKFDLIISITALEHIVNDKQVVSKADLLLKPTGIQIHIVPSFWALFLYLTHGYRQYNPRRLKNLFGEYGYQVFRMGGLFSFFLHFLFITIPFFVFKTEKLRELKIYPKLVNICNELDRFVPLCSSMYAVILEKKKQFSNSSAS